MAHRGPTGPYEIEAPEPAGSGLDLLGILGNAGPSPTGDGSPVLLGVDFPLGVPAAYAARVGLRSFRALLERLGSGGALAGLHEIAATLDEVSLERPFYPAGRVVAGSARRGDHAGALGLPLEALWRTCDRLAGAEALFWTLGPRQVGKAAIAGWRELLVPLVTSSGTVPGSSLLPSGSSVVACGSSVVASGSSVVASGSVSSAREVPAPGAGVPAPIRGDAHGGPAVGLWPFDGELGELLAARRLVVAEAWPSMGRRLLPSAPGSPRWSKRTVEGRRAQGDRIRRLAQSVGASPSDAASVTIERGFVDSGEDGFDAFVGLLGMLDVLQHGEALPSPPDRPEPAILDVEGWILGLPAEGLRRTSKGGDERGERRRSRA